MNYMTRIPALLAVMGLLLFPGCKKEETGHGGAHHIKLNTQMVTVGGYRVAFDFLGKKGHDEMLKGMNIAQSVIRDSDRFVLITIMDAAANKLVRDARVTVSVTGPSGKAAAAPVTAVTGGGMHHFTAGFPAHDKGDYRVDAEIRVKGTLVKASATYKAE